MQNAILNAALLIGILAVSYLLTNWFARAMYKRCSACGTLNAKRRAQCRSCQKDLTTDKQE